MANKKELHEFREQLKTVELTVAGLRKRLELIEDSEKIQEIHSHVPPPEIKKSHYPDPSTLREESLEKRVQEAQVMPTDDQKDKRPQDYALAQHPQEEKSIGDIKLTNLTKPIPQQNQGKDSLTFFIHKLIKFISPKEKMGWEMALGTYWLPRIAVIVLAIGITWLTTLAIQKYAGPYMAHIRISLGFGICAALFLIGKWLEPKSSEYARILMASAFSMTYFITFATHYLPYTQIFLSPEPTLLAVTIIVFIWAFLAHNRRSVLLAIGMVFLSELTITTATLTSMFTHVYAPAGIIILSIGGMFFMLRHRWYHIGALTMIATNCNLTLWFFKAQPTDTVASFTIGMSLLAAHYLLLTGGEYFSGSNTKKYTVPNRWRRWYVAINSAAFFTLGLLLVRGSSFASPYVYIFYAMFATSLLLIGCAYLKRTPIDPLFNVFFTKASALYVLTLAAYFEGATLTITLSLEAFILLIAARRWQLPINRILASVVAIGALLQGIYTGLESPEIVLGSREYLSQIIPMFLSAMTFMGLSLLYQRTDWRDHKLPLTDMPTYLHRIAWQMHLLKEKPHNSSDLFFNGNLFSHFYALGSTLLILAFSHVYFSKDYQATGLSLLVFVLVFAAIALKSSSFFYASLPISAAAITFFHLILKDMQIAPGWIPTLLFWIPFIVLIEIPITPLLYNKLRAPAYFSKVQEDYQLSVWNVLYLIAAIELYSVGIWKMLPDAYWVMTSALFALIATLYALMRPVKIFSLAALAFMIIAGLFAVSELGNSSSFYSMIIGIFSAWAAAILSDHWFKNKYENLINHQSIEGPYMFYGLATWVTLSFFCGYQNLLSDSLSISITGVLLTVLIPVLHRRALTCCAVSALIWGYMTWLIAPPEATMMWHLLGISLPIITVSVDRYINSLAVFKQNFAGYCLIVMSAVGMVWYLDNSIISKEWVPFSVTLVSMLYLGYAIVFRNIAAGIVSLVIGAVTTMYFILPGFITFLVYDVDLYATKNIPIIFSYSALFMFWLAWERTYRLSGEHQIKFEIDSLFCALMGLMLCLLCYRLPALQHYYLTISWALSAVALFVLAVLLKQKYLRYTGFGVLLLSLGRVFLVDTKELAPIYRISAIIFLSIMMLFVAYGYVYARRKMATQNEKEDRQQVL